MSFTLLKLSPAQILCVQCFDQNDSIGINVGTNNLIINGGFENSTCNTSTFYPYFCPNSASYSCNVANWTCSGGDTSTYSQINTLQANNLVVEGINVAYFGNGFSAACSSTFPDTSCLNNTGTGCIVTGLPLGYPVSMSNMGGALGVSLSQSITGLVIGNTYVLEFWAGGEGDSLYYFKKGLFAVDVGFGNIFLRNKPTVTGSIGTRFIIQFKAIAITQTIKFTNWGHICVNCTELLLDNVRLYPPNYLPESFLCSTLCAPTISAPTTILCDQNPPVTLTSATLGGVWTSSCGACIDPNTGVFDPAVSGPGFDTIFYTVYYPCHGADTIIMQVISGPTASITGNTTICPGSNLTLTASGGGTYLWWYSADSSTTMTVNPIIPTTYIVEVKNIQGCTDTASVHVVLFPSPFADFSPNDVCINEVINFNNLSTIPSGTITAWSWSFGDGSPLLFIQSPSHTYLNIGSFPVTLIVTSNNGCKDTIIKNIVVHPLPVAQFLAENACKGDIISFTNLSSITGTDVMQTWLWTFGDGSSVNNNQNPSHIFSDTGSYAIKLLVISNFGCGDSISKMVKINPRPIINFTAPNTIGCNPLCVNLQNTATISSGSNASFLWNFGDGSTFDQSPNPNHCYANNSALSQLTFDVTLTVTSDSGCVSIYSKNNFITVNPIPIADFSVQPDTASINDPIISFTDLSLGENSWNWNFGDFTTSSMQTPLPHSYADTGKYLIALIVSNQYTCFNTAYKTIFIEPFWSFFIPNAFSPDGNGNNDYFQGYGNGILEYEMMIFDRWGKLIYKTKDYNLPWDGGANNGKDIAQIDVYVYVIKIKDLKEVKHIYRGIVSLVK